MPLALRLLPFLFLIFPTLSLAQLLPDLPAAYCAKLAQQARLQREFQQALEWCDKASLRDSSLALVWHERAEIYFDQEKYSKAAEAAQEALKLQNEQQPRLHDLLGTSLIRDGKGREGQQILEQAIDQYPGYALSAMHLGEWCEDIHDADLALQYYQIALSRNPNLIVAHALLGRLARSAGYHARGILCWNTALMLDPDAEWGLADIIEESATGHWEQGAASMKFRVKPGPMESLEALLITQDFEDKQHKLKTKPNRTYTRVNHFIQQHLDLTEGDSTIWNTLYIPFFKDITDVVGFEAWQQHSLNHQSYMKPPKWLPMKNAEETRLALHEAWRNHQKKTWARLNGKWQQVSATYFEDGNVSSFKEERPLSDPTLRYVEQYHPNGALAIQGYHNAAGQKDSLETEFHPNGHPKGLRYYRAGRLHGPFQVRNSKGVLIEEGVHVDDRREGKVQHYFSTGGLSRIDSFTHGELNGPSISFYRHGGTSEVRPYRMGKIHGILKTFHPNGELAMARSYHHGNEFQQMTYDEMGNLHWDIAIDTTNYVITLQRMHPNGKLRQSGQMFSGNYQKTWKRYYDDGTLESSVFYENGKKQGLESQYTTSGQCWHEVEYALDTIKSYRFYDTFGTLIKEGKVPAGSISYEGFYPHGEVRAKGTLKDYQRDGQWQFFDPYGHLDTETSGLQQTIYYPNGQIRQKLVSIGELDTEGSARYGKSWGWPTDTAARRHLDLAFPDLKNWQWLQSFHPNGKIASEGAVYLGEAIGFWHAYAIDGGVTERKFFRAGKSDGWQETFAIGGSLRSRAYHDAGLLTKVIYYDESGKAIETLELPHATGSLRAVDAAGTQVMIGHYKDGMANGKFRWNAADGSIEIEGRYLNDSPHGFWRWTEDDKTSSGYYLQGAKDSLWQSTVKGVVIEEAHYRNGQSEGKYIERFENGQIRLHSTFKNDQQEGAERHYSPEGTPVFERFFEAGRWTKTLHRILEGEEAYADTLTYTGADTILTLQYFNDSLALRAEVISGVFHGSYQSFHPNGQSWIRASYVNGELDANYEENHADGTPHLRSQYLCGQKHGKEIKYHPNGLQKSSINYHNDKRHGEAIWYDESGRSIRKATFRNGREVL